MPASIPFLIERLRIEGEKTAAFFETLAPDRWQVPVYTDGEAWTVRSLLAHFVSSEREMLNLFSNIQQGGPGVAPDFDLDRFNAGQQRKTADATPAELIDQFRRARAEMLAFVAGLREPDLERSGRHPALGVMALGDMIKIVYRHNHMHERDLRQALPGSYPSRA